MRDIFIDITVVISLVLCGVVPCVMVAPFWIVGLFFIFGIFSSFDAFIVFFLALSGLAGLCFFISIILHYLCDKPWTIFQYIIGFYGLIGFVCFIYMSPSTFNLFLTKFHSWEDYIILLPPVGLMIAYLTRYKPNLTS